MLSGLRGLLGIAVAWGIAWIPLGMLVGMLDGMVHGRGLVAPNMAVAAPLLASVGAVCGFGFGLVLAGMERRRTMAGLSFPRVVAWGVAGSCVIPSIHIGANLGLLTLGGALEVLAIFGTLGGTCAAATFALARRGEHQRGSQEPPLALGDPVPDSVVQQHVADRERR